MTKSPAFQFYPDDFVGSGKVGQMTVQEVGVFVLLLCLDWSDGGFAFDVTRLARWCRVSPRRFEKCWEHVSQCFQEKDGRMYNPRLELERDRQRAWREKSAAGGRKCAETRWGGGDKGGYEMVTEKTLPNGNTPSPSPSPVTTTTGDKGLSGTEKPKGYPPEFELLWNAYPKRFPASNKAGAYRGYCSHLKKGVAYDVMLEGVKSYAAAMVADGKVGTRYVLDAKTFFGPDKHFLNEYSDAPPDATAAKLWAEMQRTGILLDSTTADWQRHIGEIVASGAIGSREDFEALWRKINANVLRGCKSERQAVEHIAAALQAKAA